MASTFRLLTLNFCRYGKCASKIVATIPCIPKNSILVSVGNQGLNAAQVRCVNNQKWRSAYLKEMKHRQKLEEKVLRPRSAFVNWNYSSELYAFSKRLNEDLHEETLRRAFIHPSYIEKEEKTRKQLVSDDNSTLALLDNTEMVKIGSLLMHKYIVSFLRHELPCLPEDGIQALHDHLTSIDMLSYIASNIGIPDLVLSADFPCETETLGTTLEALIGAIITDQGSERAEKFILDLIITQLIGKDIMDIWEIPNPVGTLRNILEKQGKLEPEPRLLRETGRNTIFSSYIVGLYVDKELIGKGPGENLEIATDMAAIDALKTMYQIQDHRTPFSFSTSQSNKSTQTLKSVEN